MGGGPSYTEGELGEELSATHVDCVGLTLSGERFLEAANLTIANARRVSLNQSLSVLVGGYTFTTRPELVAAVGADAMAADAPAAVATAARLVAETERDALLL